MRVDLLIKLSTFELCRPPSDTKHNYSGIRTAILLNRQQYREHNGNRQDICKLGRIIALPNSHNHVALHSTAKRVPKSEQLYQNICSPGIETNKIESYLTSCPAFRVRFLQRCDLMSPMLIRLFCSCVIDLKTIVQQVVSSLPILRAAYEVDNSFWSIESYPFLY